MSARISPVGAGFAALSHRKLVLLLAVTTLVLGAFATLPLVPTLKEAMTETLAGDHFARNNAAFAPTDFLDLMKEDAAAFTGTRFAAGWLAIFGVLLQMFYAGGIIAVLGRGRFTFGQFLEPARRNAWHNLKCFFLFALSLAIVLGAWVGGTGAARKKLFEDAPPDAAARSVTFWIVAVVAVLLFAALSLLYDFARAARRFSPQIGAWRSYRFARRALSGCWARAIALWVFWFALGGAAVLGLLAVTWGMPAVSLPAIGLLMLLQLGVFWLRSAARIAAWGSYVEFLEPRAPRALSAVAKVTIAAASPSPAFAPTRY